MTTFQRDPELEFEKVLTRARPEHRAKIMEAWREFGPKVIHVLSREALALHGITSMAATRGAEYFFREELFTEAPDSVLHSAIAHELSHTVDLIERILEVVRLAKLGLWPLAPSEAEARRQAIENAASERVKAWNFEEYAPMQWWGEHYAHE